MATVTGADEGTETGERIRAAATQLAAAGEGSRRTARDPVNEPTIRNWVEALDDPNPVYVDSGAAGASVHGEPVAPPAMIQVWTMPGLRPDPQARAEDPLHAMMGVLDEAGYTSVVATESTQTYYRYLRMGEQLEVSTRLEGVAGPKQTAVGEGWFVTTISTWWAGDEPVGRMRFTVLKFRPKSGSTRGPGDAEAAATSGRPGERDEQGERGQPVERGEQRKREQGARGEPYGDVLRPAVNRDTAFFWEGTRAGELRIQRCADCGELRHPPGPRCVACGSMRRGHTVAGGRGTIFSYVVHHHPPVPGKGLPLVIVLVELEEGVRMLGELRGADPGAVEIGQPVVSRLERVDDDLTLPAWVPATRRATEATPEAAQQPTQRATQEVRT